MKNNIDLDTIKSDLKADYRSGTCPGVWLFTRGEATATAFIPTQGQLEVSGKAVKRDHQELKGAIGKALVRSLVEQVALRTGYGLKDGRDGWWTFVTPKSVESSEDLSTADGAVTFCLYNSQPDQAFVAGSKKPVTDLSVTNLAKHVRKHMAQSIVDNRDNAIARDYQRAMFEAKKAIIAGLRTKGVQSDDTTRLQVNSMERHPSGYLVTIEFKRDDVLAEFTVTGTTEVILNESVRKINILKTL